MRGSPSPYRLGLLETGGTIGSTWDGNGSIHLRRDREYSGTPLIRDQWIGPRPVRIQVRRPFTLSSEEFVPLEWRVLAESVRELADGGTEGVVVLHGTDTAAYSCAALSFLLSDLNVPIVVTGANLPEDHPESDASANVRAALIAVGRLPGGVYLTFVDETRSTASIHLGTRVRKQPSGGETYQSVNHPPVAKITDDEFHEMAMFRPPRVAPRSRDVDPRVLAVRCHPGLDFAALRQAVRAAGTKGVVVELYASATGPTRPGSTSLTDFAAWCRERGIVVVAALWSSQADDPVVYESTAALREVGAVILPGILPEVATVKLMWALASGDDVIELMRRSVVGEFGEHAYAMDRRERLTGGAW